MAYSIVLNLTGNANDKVDKLSASLATADANAVRLAGRLTTINALLRGMPSTNVPIPVVPNTPTTTGQPNYTRHKHTRIASYGVGGSVGPFSGRLSTILQPDAHGNIAGLNAVALAKAVNIGAVVTSILAQASKAAVKTVAYSSIAPAAIGGTAIGFAVRSLRSQNFAEGVRLISRRHQAQLGLGPEYEQAQANADFLASSYGLDRSSSLSSINVLTGLGIGGQGRRLSLNESTDLTKIAGLISQHHGVPFERVATNIQQLLVQDRPHIRDIRELLNQAPILGKYALKEIEDRGLVGVDIREYLKDQKNILSVLHRYGQTVATNAGMQARGQISLASQDAWARVASNDQFWGLVGDRGSGIIGAFASGIESTLTTLANNPEFNNAVRNIEYTITNGFKLFNTAVEKFSSAADAVLAFFGVDIGNRQEAARQNDIDALIRSSLADPRYQSIYREIYDKNNLGFIQGAKGEEEFQRWLQNDAFRALKNDQTLRDLITGSGEFKGASQYSLLERAGLVTAGLFSGYGLQYSKDGNLDLRDFGPLVMRNPFTNAYDRSVGTIAGRNEAIAASVDTRTAPNYVSYRPNVGNYTQPSSAFAQYGTEFANIYDSLQRYAKAQSQVGGLDPSLFPSNGAGAGAGDDLTGYNKDRRSLVINFNDRLVEWNSTIVSNNPEEVVNEVSDSLDQIVSAAIQRALLGATGTTGVRF